MEEACSHLAFPSHSVTIDLSSTAESRFAAVTADRRRMAASPKDASDVEVVPIPIAIAWQDERREARRAAILHA